MEKGKEEWHQKPFYNTAPDFARAAIQHGPTVSRRVGGWAAHPQPSSHPPRTAHAKTCHKENEFCRSFRHMALRNSTMQVRQHRCGENFPPSIIGLEAMRRASHSGCDPKRRAKKADPMLIKILTHPDKRLDLSERLFTSENRTAIAKPFVRGAFPRWWTTWSSSEH